MDFENDSESTAIVEQVNALADKAANYVVRTHAQYEALALDLVSNKDAQKRIAAKKKELMDPASKTIAAIRAFFAPVEARLQGAESAAKRALLDYEEAQRARAAEEQRKADEKAEKERLRLAKIAADNEAKAAAARAAGDEKAAAKFEAKAEAAEEKESYVMAPVIEREPPKVKGVSTRKTYSAEVTDLMALVKAVAAGQAPLAYVTANEKVLDAQARALQDQFVCPGVKVVDKTIMAAGRR